MNILIIGCNGFIGSHLSEYIVESTAWNVSGIDLSDDNISSLKENPNFTFSRMDMTEDLDAIASEVSQCDVVIPLGAIAKPKLYITDPIKVFELDFEANLSIVRECVKHKKRLIFPSTSEVYGLCQDDYFDESSSNLTLGPINKTRWIYSCSKQLLDRVIWAYKDEGLDFTIFRPFNWIGPNLDDIYSKQKESRVITQFIGNIIAGEPLELVDGGKQKRTFTDIRDGISALMKIIVYKEETNHKILNIGSPENEYSIEELALILMGKFREHESLKYFVKNVQLRSVKPGDYYGEGYQDVIRRVPNIEKMKAISNWRPEYTLHDSIDLIINQLLEKGIRTK